MSSQSTGPCLGAVVIVDEAWYGGCVTVSVVKGVKVGREVLCGEVEELLGGLCLGGAIGSKSAGWRARIGERRARREKMVGKYIVDGFGGFGGMV